MNGAVYISFFQGQLESVLEQVVQLAVQEISRTVGSSLNALLLETAVKEQENHRIRLQLQEPREAPCAGGERAGGGRTKAREQQQQQQQQQQRQHPPDRHGSGGPGTESGGATDTRRLEHKGRVVDQLKSVMEKVLDFAVSELTKIVEASYDDLLLEITKMEHERRHLEESLDRGEQAGSGRRHGSENDSVSPSGSEEAREEACEEKVSKKKKLEDPPPPRVQSKPQDWVPILDKVFGQKWTDDSWPAGESGRGSRESRPAQHKSTSAVIMEPSPYSPQQDPRWTPLEDMEVFSPDVENGHQNSRGRTISVAGPLPGSSGQRSSASMLQRLLTLPSQLLEEDSAKETLVSMAMDSSTGPGPAPPTLPADKELDEDGEEGEEGEEEERGKKRKRRRVWSECEDCGRRFSRVSQLKSHRLTHAGAASDWVPATPPGASGSSPLQCSDCGKRFSSATRLHSHMRTLHPGPEPD